MNKTLLLILCFLGLTSCQSGQPKEQSVQDSKSPVVSTATVQSLPAPVSSVSSATSGFATETQLPMQNPAAPVVIAAAPSSTITVSAPVAAIPAVVNKPKSQPVLSDAEAIALAKKRSCFGCHTVNTKVYGPAWKDVAAKYRGDASAQARLVDKVGKGGAGVWGSMAMPAQTQASEIERAQLVRFILNLK